MASPAPNDPPLGPLAPDPPLLPPEEATAAAAAAAAAPAADAAIRELEEQISVLATHHGSCNTFDEHERVARLFELADRGNMPERYLKFVCMYGNELVAAQAHHNGGFFSFKHLWELPLSKQDVDVDSPVELPPIVSGLFSAELQDVKSVYPLVNVGKVTKQLTHAEKSHLCKETIYRHASHPRVVELIRRALAKAAGRKLLNNGHLDIKYWDLYDEQELLCGGVKEKYLDLVSGRALQE
jgi:hypothetical protein